MFPTIIGKLVVIHVEHSIMIDVGSRSNYGSSISSKVVCRATGNCHSGVVIYHRSGHIATFLYAVLLCIFIVRYKIFTVLLLDFHLILGGDLIAILVMKPLIAACILHAKEAVLYHNEKDILNNAIKSEYNKWLHNATEGEEHEIGHAEKESEIYYVIKDIV